MKDFLKNNNKVIISSSLTGILSFIFGVSYEKKFIKKQTKKLGTLRIDRSEKDEPDKLFLELEADINELENCKIAVFDVLRKDYISQK